MGKFQLGVQTKNVVKDANPEEGFTMLAQAGFSCADFSLNDYLKNGDIYQAEVNTFFDRSVAELENYFAPHKRGAQAAGIKIQQMHMPYRRKRNGSRRRGLSILLRRMQRIWE